MPVSFRLPLPNFKVYLAGSVLLLSMTVYHAIGVTSDPMWRANATRLRNNGEVEIVVPATKALVAGGNDTRGQNDQFVDVMNFMMQEPMCLFTMINMSYCTLALLALGVQRAVFGPLRVAEAQRVKEKMWNYLFYKFVFVFGVVNVQYLDEVLLWCFWFTLVGFLHLMGQLCKDRFEYLSVSGSLHVWAHVRLVALLGGVLAASGALMLASAALGLPVTKDTFAFMAAECLLVAVAALHVLARYALALRGADPAGPHVYYTHLCFDSALLVLELAHVVHMVVHSNMVVSMPSLVLLMQLRHLLHELQSRVSRHRLYAALHDHMNQHYPMASKEEMGANEDNCAICWEPMKEARKLPCSHFFHNSCLCQWVQQDASCPTCRRPLLAAAPRRAPAAASRPPHAPHDAPPAAHVAPQPNHMFHFDGSRYVSWLPSFSVAVMHGRAAATPAQLDAMARQVQQMFPAHALGALAADLAVTRSAALTVDNILEGRLAPPSPGAFDAPLRPHAPHAPYDLNRPYRSRATADAATSASASASASTSHQHEGPAFSALAGEREHSLRRRKLQLLQAARRRYLARAAAPHCS